MSTRTKKNGLILALALAVSACGSEDVETEGLVDGADDAFLVGGKADGMQGDCAEANLLRFVNDPANDIATLKAKGIHTRAAKNIFAYRVGEDGEAGTADDRAFASLQEVDDVYYVGPVALRQLLKAAGTECPAEGSAQAIFSPQPYEQSHLAEMARLVDAAEVSIDLAMYSFSDARLYEALGRAVERGVVVRAVFHPANGDHRDPDGSKSARLEDRGVDVRYINKIMHHKYAIFDGPQSDLAEAETAILATGSANWSNSAGVRYDENTVVLVGHAEANLRFQREFNHMWANSRDFVWSEAFEFYTTLDITEDDIAAVDDAGLDVAMTSDNFRTYVHTRYGPTFSVERGRNTVSNRLVALIEGAEESIHVASGHLRSRPVSEALMRVAEARPEVDIKIYLDGQEYVSQWRHDEQLADLDDCLEEAGDDADDIELCEARGFRFGLQVALAGVDVRYKYYAYRWHYSYAEQMHHKYILVDGETLATGSYNLSDTAENDTLENVVFYEAERFPALVAAFEANFDALWDTGLANNAYEKLVDTIRNGDDAEVPTVFPSMALDWNQVTALKAAIRDACGGARVGTTCERR